MGLSVIWVIDWLVGLKQLSIGWLLAFVFMHTLKKKQLKSGLYAGRISIEILFMKFDITLFSFIQ